MAHFGDYSLENNATLKLDLSILGASHLYKGEGIPFDPEGILGIIPSLVNILAGFLVVDFFAKIAPIKIASFLFALAFMQVCWFVGYLLDKNKIYIRV